MVQQPAWLAEAGRLQKGQPKLIKHAQERRMAERDNLLAVGNLPMPRTPCSVARPCFPRANGVQELPGASQVPLQVRIAGQGSTGSATATAGRHRGAATGTGAPLTETRAWAEARGRPGTPPLQAHTHPGGVRHLGNRELSVSGGEGGDDCSIPALLNLGLDTLRQSGHAAGGCCFDATEDGQWYIC